MLNVADVCVPSCPTRASPGSEGASLPRLWVMVSLPWGICLHTLINLTGGRPDEREVLVFKEEAQEMGKLGGS